MNNIRKTNKRLDYAFKRTEYKLSFVLINRAALAVSVMNVMLLCIL